MDQTLVGPDGYLNQAGRQFLIDLLAHVERGNHQEAFVPLVKGLGLVPAGIEIVLVREGQVYLTHRDDEYFTGWHTPGSYLHQGESEQDAVNRCAERELGCRVEIVRTIGVVNHTGPHPRFQDLCVLALCRIVEGEPEGGQWFAEKPNDFLEVQDMYWPYIEAALV